MFKEGLVTPYELKSDFLNRNVKLGIYLPKNYTPLYKHHVIIAFDGQDFAQLGQLHRSYEKLYEQGEIERALIVYVHYIDGKHRKLEYHPELDSQDATIQFVLNELLPFTDKTFSTLKTGNARILMGDSLAASLSLAITLKFPQTFSQALLLSPMISERIYQKLEQCINPYNLDYYLVVGKEEHDFTLLSGEQADFLTPIQNFHNVLEDSAITHEYKELEGGHTWKTWKPELELALKYFLS